MVQEHPDHSELPFVAYLCDQLPGGRGFNPGDLVINAGVQSLISAVLPSRPVTFYRKAFELPHDGAEVAALVYAGMPQFGARDDAIEDEIAWNRLREHYGTAPVSMNIGGGTGYSLSSNRLAVAFDMATKSYGQQYFQRQQDVLFHCRDPLSAHYLSLLGLLPRLSLCPSFFAPAISGVQRRYGLVIAPVLPSKKLSEDERGRIRFGIGDLIRLVIQRQPDAVVICQEPEELTWCESLGASHIVTPASHEDMVRATAEAEFLVSMRVHATVSALIQSTPVLHLAIDGRSDLLTPAMAGGLEKQSIYGIDLEDMLSRIARFRTEKPQVDISRIRQVFFRQMTTDIQRFLVQPSSVDPLLAGHLALAPERVARMRPHDQIVYLDKHFRTNDAVSRGEDGTLLPARAIGQHSIYGPYRALPFGNYRVVFDCEWWGRYLGEELEVELDVSNGEARPLAQKRIPITEALVGERSMSIEFANPGQGSDLEFRLQFRGIASELLMRFYGTRVIALGRSV